MFSNDALVNFLLNLPTTDKIKQTGATCLEKLVQWNYNIMFWLTFAKIHSVEIAFFIFIKIQLVVYYQCCVLIGWPTTRLYVIAHY